MSIEYRAGDHPDHPTPGDPRGYCLFGETLLWHGPGMYGTPEWEALVGWLREHDINPAGLPSFAEITRAGDGITYYAYRRRDGRILLHRGEPELVEVGVACRPKPWPEQLRRCG